MDEKSYNKIKNLLEQDIECSKSVIESGEKIFFEMAKAIAEQKDNLATSEKALAELIEAVEECDEEECCNDD